MLDAVLTALMHPLAAYRYRTRAYSATACRGDNHAFRMQLVGATLAQDFDRVTRVSLAVGARRAFCHRRWPACHYLFCCAGSDRQGSNPWRQLTYNRGYTDT